MMNKTDALKDRVEARKYELLSKLSDLKADTRSEAVHAHDTIKHELSELETYLKEGWEKVTDATRQKLDQWLNKDKGTAAKH